MSTTGGPFRAAVLGSPISHSKSPLLHGAAYGALGLDCSYSALDVGVSSLEGFVRDVRRTPGWRGLSVTMPLKAAIVPLTDHVSELALLLGVANTVVVSPPGRDGAPRLTAHNTDVIGIEHALGAAGAVTPGSAVLLGGGGTAAAAVAGLASLGTAAIRVVVRRPEAAADLLRIGKALDVEVDVVGWDTAATVVRDADVVVSTLPPRAADGIASILGADSCFRADGVLLDVAYDPWPSAIAEAWSAAGGTVVAGLEMLLHQAVEQVRLFFPEIPQDPDHVLGVMRKALVATPP